MSADRVARIGRLVDARRAAADSVVIELDACAIAVARAGDAAAEARDVWFSAMSRAPVMDSSAELADESAYAVALGRRYEMSLRVLDDAKTRHEACRRRLCAARTEVKKLEKIRDRLLAHAAAEGGRHEQRSADAVAAARGARTP
jgi:flagellar export protein FliJ